MLVSITIWALLFLVLHVRSVFHFPSISTIATSVSFWYNRLSSLGPLVTRTRRLRPTFVCYLLVEAGYFVNLSKSQCTPSTFVTFLGFICYSIRQPFLIPEEKKVKFKVLRENVLTCKTVTLKTLQRFAGKAVSFSLAITGCELYLREIFKAVSGLVRNSKLAIKVTGLLQSELEYWRFLDDWSDSLPWRSERQFTATLYCDASKRAWGGRFDDG